MNERPLNDPSAYGRSSPLSPIYGNVNHGNSNNSQITMEDVMNTMEKLQELERKQKEGSGCDVFVLTEEEIREIEKVRVELSVETRLLGIPVFVAKDFEEFTQLVLDLTFKQNKKVGYIWPKMDLSDGMEERVTSQNESMNSPQEGTPTETTPTPEV